MNDRDRLDQVAELVGRLFENTLTDEDAETLERLVCEDATARECYLEMMDLHADLNRTFSGTTLHPPATDEKREAAGDGTNKKSRLSFPGIGPIQQRVSLLSAYLFQPARFGVFFAQVTILLLLLVLAHIKINVQPTPPAGVSSAPAPRRPLLVARYTNQIGAVWAPELPAPFGGEYLREGKELRLLEGAAEITFDSGAKIVLEGPAAVTLLSSTEALLTHGKLLAIVDDPQAKGFAVDTPLARVIDLGTQFRVEVEEAGRTDLHVLIGEVEIEQKSQNARKLVAAGRSFRIFPDSDEFIAIPHDDAGFAEWRREGPSSTFSNKIWLGNLFDDPKGTPLDIAMRTDAYGATPAADCLGVERVVYGGPAQVEIDPGVRLDLTNLGWTSQTLRLAANDVWGGAPVQGPAHAGVDTNPGIATRGKLVKLHHGKREEGVGFSGNTLITFDLDEIRAAGDDPQAAFSFCVDRAGLNDSVHGKAAAAHLLAVVSDDQRVLSAWLNGQACRVEEQNGAWQLVEPLPAPLKAEGRFVAANLPLPPHARKLTLASIAAGKVFYDRVVWSGARLEISAASQP